MTISDSKILTAQFLRNVGPNRFEPAPQNRSQEAAKKFSEFYCFTFAKVMTETFEANSFEEEMIYSSFYPEAMGKALSESSIGDDLRDKVLETLDQDKGLKNTKSNSSIEKYQKRLQSSEVSKPLMDQQNDLPKEMFQREKWGC